MCQKTAHKRCPDYLSDTGICIEITNMDIQRLLDLRKLTQAVSRQYESKLKSHLVTLAPLFSPLPLFGEYARGGKKSSGSHAEKAYRELCARFQSIANQKPFSLDLDLTPPVDLFAATPSLTPIEYDYTIHSGEANHHVSVTSPLRWTLSFPEAEPKRLMELTTDDRSQAKETLNHALLQAIAMAILIEQRPGLTNLFQDLRCPLQTIRFDELGGLPFISISAPIGTRLPSDEIILQNTQLTGIPSFEEILDINDIRNLSDPVQREFLSMAESLCPTIYKEITD